ncbi:MAG: DUF2905 domain-containing protein [Candidatus Levybacteria bacterium]|nr:DUF2905 domain-containing protein [Candidatus Levybacteria bacterium]
MADFGNLGKIIIYFGLILVVLGIVLITSPKIPFIGKLPGDIFVKRDGFSFFFPLATSIIISIILTILFNRK